MWNKRRLRVHGSHNGLDLFACCVNVSLGQMITWLQLGER